MSNTKMLKVQEGSGINRALLVDDSSLEGLLRIRHVMLKTKVIVEL